LQQEGRHLLGGFFVGNQSLAHQNPSLILPLMKGRKLLTLIYPFFNLPKSLFDPAVAGQAPAVAGQAPAVAGQAPAAAGQAKPPLIPP